MDVLAWLRTRNKISPSEARAGELLRAVAVEAMGPRVGSTWPVSERVQTSRRDFSMPRSPAEAETMMRALARLMGCEAFEVTCRVCIHGEHIALIAAAMEPDPKVKAQGGFERATRDMVSMHLRAGLAAASALFLGKATGPKRSRMAAAFIGERMSFAQFVEQAAANEGEITE